MHGAVSEMFNYYQLFGPKKKKKKKIHAWFELRNLSKLNKVW